MKLSFDDLMVAVTLGPAHARSNLCSSVGRIVGTGHYCPEHDEPVSCDLLSNVTSTSIQETSNRG